MSPSDPGERPEPEDLSAGKGTSRGPLLAVLIGLLVLTGAGTGIYLLTTADEPAPGSSATSTEHPLPPATVPSRTTDQPDAGGGSAAQVRAARTIAERAMAAMNAGDPVAVLELSCDKTVELTAEDFPPQARREIAADPEVVGDSATVQVKLTIAGQSSTLPLPLRKVDGTWCVD